MLAVIGRIRLFSDADNSEDIAHFDKMIPLFKEGYDIVIASRHPKDAAGAWQAVPQARYKRIMGQLGTLIVRSVAVRGIWDTQCGFKAFRSEVAKRIFSISVAMTMPRISLRCVASIEVTVEDIDLGIKRVPWQPCPACRGCDQQGTRSLPRGQRRVQLRLQSTLLLRR